VSTVPAIAQVVVLPTLGVSLAITPPTVLTAIGAAVLTYTLTFDGGTLASPLVISGVEFTQHNSWHCVKGVGESTLFEHRGEVLAVRAAAVGSLGSSSDSVPADVNMLVETSRPATIRQRIHDMLVSAAIMFHGKQVRIHGDEFGKPRTWIDGKESGDKRPFIEVGVCYTVGEQDDSADGIMQQNELPFRVFVHADDPDEAEWAEAIAERMRAELTTDIGLTGFGLADGGYSWRMSKPEAAKNLFYVEQILTLPPGVAPRGVALY
jgi:hypothetical protein